MSLAVLVVCSMMMIGCDDEDDALPWPWALILLQQAKDTTVSGGLAIEISIDDGRVINADHPADLPHYPAARGAIVFAPVPAGHLVLADGRRLTVAEDLRVAVCELTRGQWLALTDTATGPWQTWPVPADTSTGDQLPAAGLSLDQVTAGLDAFHARHPGLPWRLDLPTAEEWEYACRAGSTTPFHWGVATTSASVATHARVANAVSARSPWPVAQTRANGFGLYDMQGNILEWVTRAAPERGELRGGSWYHPLALAAADHRVPFDPGTAYALAGVRLVARPALP